MTYQPVTTNPPRADDYIVRFRHAGRPMIGFWSSERGWRNGFGIALHGVDRWCEVPRDTQGRIDG